MTQHGGQRRRDPNVGRQHQRHADIVNRSCNAASAPDDMRSWFETAVEDKRLRRAVVICDIEIEIEGERMRNGEIVRFITRADVCAVRDEAGEHDDDDRKKARTLEFTATEHNQFR